MCDGGNSCPDTPKMTLRRRWLQLRWRTVGQIQWRMELLTGHHAWLRRQSPSNKPLPDVNPRRPRGIWFWTKQYTRSYVAAIKWRMQRMTGYHHYRARRTIEGAGLKLKKELTYDG